MKNEDFEEIDSASFCRIYKADILIVTATSIELEVSLSFLRPISDDDQIKIVYLTNTTIYFGLYGKYSAAIVKTNSMGSIQRGGSCQTSTEAIEILKPRALFMVGIAFGKDKKTQKIGDLLISKSICIYDPTRVNYDGSIEYRGPNPESNLILYNRCTQKTVHEYEYEGKANKAHIIGGPMLSGERLIDNIDLKKKLFSQYPNAIGGEMEGAGIYAASDASHTPWIILKAVCDWGDGKKNKVDQKEAAFSSNSFLFSILSSDLSLKSLSITPFKDKYRESAEINIDAEDLLKLLVPRRYWSNLESSRKEIRIPDKKIYYEYYCYDNNGREEGIIFLGKNITIRNTFTNFKQSYDPPATLSVYLTKKVKNGRLVDRIKGIKEKAKEYGLTRSSKWEVNYIDEVIWDCTLSNSEKLVHVKRNDYIDQHLYSIKSFNNSIKDVGKSTNVFFKKLETSQESSTSIVFGSGGVGKTTFCDALRNQFDKVASKCKKKVIIIKGERISQIGGVKEAYVESLRDLYNLYAHEQDSNEISDNDFILNYMCGNVVVIIDGLDEIDSALGERFKVDLFFKSLEMLDDRFHNTKIIITTRDYFKETLTHSSSVFKSYRLNGFTEKDLDEYLHLRLSDRNLESDAKKILDEKKLTVNEYFVPMLVDWVCEITLRKKNDKINRPFQKNSKYLLKGAVFDEILIDLITREIEKQSIGCTIDELFELLVEIILDHQGVISRKNMEEYVKYSFEEEVEKFLKNPLFNVSSDGQSITLKYDALSSLVKSRYLKLHLEERRDFTDKSIRLLTETFDGKSSLLNDLVASLVIDEEDSVTLVKHYISHLSAKVLEQSNANKKRNIHKCISGLTYIAFMKSNRTNKKERAELLNEIFNTGGMISNCRIFGDFYALDFSEIKFLNSSFIGYEKFESCIFPEAKNILFASCYFENINIEKKCGARKEHFESTCNYHNSNIENVIDNFDREHESLLDEIKNNIISISRYIDSSRKSLNLIKLHTTIKWINGHKGFINELENKEYLNVNKKGLYSIAPRYSDSVSDVKNGTIPLLVEEIIYSIAQELK